MSRTISIVILLTALVLLVGDLHAQLRTWKDASGSFSIEADLIELTADTATLRRSDNTVVVVPLSKLCDADRLYIQEVLTPSSSLPFADDTSITEPVPEPIRYDSSLDAFWGGYAGVMQQLTDKGPMPAKVVEQLKMISSWAPESVKQPRVPMIMFLSGLILAPLAYIWLLIHEFRASLLWGIAQITADLVGSCFFPLLGGIVFVIFSVNNFSDSWKPILMNALVLTLVFGAFVMVPGEVYSGITPPAPDLVAPLPPPPTGPPVPSAPFAPFPAAP